MKPATDRGGVVLVGEGGVRTLPTPRDPIQTWIELMEVVEALRPKGRPRPPRRTTGRFLL
ncbi:hypothetical protein [Lysobacter sp. D1-1-M9]|uniref:hypothetical protein n=1 Tax=Novilysobacter longmucuonensis TaxID=3098603 RepID=UPI002FC7FE20